MTSAVPAALTAIGFDADDTLWHNERLYQMTEQHFTRLLDEHAGEALVSSRLLEAERRNLAIYGYGVKGFTLSMIETALELTGNKVPPAVIKTILDFGQAMLRHPVEALPHARETLQALSGQYRLILISKGDLFDQERKLAQSGLGELFAGVEIVSEKRAETYSRVFRRHGDGAERAMMVGNSLKSDVIPALAAGCWGVHVPHDLTWALEQGEEPAGDLRYHRIDHLGHLGRLVGQIT